MTLLGVYREQIFSPEKVREDSTILDATLLELSRQGYNTYALKAEELEAQHIMPGWVLSMAQSHRTLNILESWHKRGIRIINSVSSVRNCYRKPLIHLLAKSGIPLPPSKILPLEKVEESISFDSSARYWLKRGDVHAIQSNDVAEVASRENLISALNHFRNSRIEEIIIQEHIEGQVVKFYGVSHDEYFSAFVASSGEEITSRMKKLCPIIQQSAKAVGLEIYGGDAILTQNGKVVLIDLNDWPSFSPCCQPAAKSIARYIMRICEGEFNGLSNCC